VHLNFPFREPLTPEPEANPPLTTEQKWRDHFAWQGRMDNEPYVRVGDASQTFAPKAAIEYVISLHIDAPWETNGQGQIIVNPPIGLLHAKRTEKIGSAIKTALPDWHVWPEVGLHTADGIKARVVSMPSMELFDKQPRTYRDQVLPPSVTARVSVEKGTVRPIFALPAASVTFVCAT
jgi:hypothetical protein